MLPTVVSDHSDLVGRFGKVLILTEHHGDIVPAALREAHDVEANRPSTTFSCLPVKEGDRPFGHWLSRHGPFQAKNNATGGLSACRTGGR